MPSSVPHHATWPTTEKTRVCQCRHLQCSCKVVWHCRSRRALEGLSYSHSGKRGSRPSWCFCGQREKGINWQKCLKPVYTFVQIKVVFGNSSSCLALASFSFFVFSCRLFWTVFFLTLSFFLPGGGSNFPNDFTPQEFATIARYSLANRF